MSPRKLEILCAHSLALVTLRQNECKHLCIENVGPQILSDVLRAHDGNYVDHSYEISPHMIREAL